MARLALLFLLLAGGLDAIPALRPQMPHRGDAPSSATREMRLDIYYYSEYVSDDWQQLFRYTYEWGDDGLVQALQVDSLNASWQPNYLYSYEHDAQGCTSEILMQTWDGAWVNDWRNDIAHNTDGNITESFTRQWVDGGWVDYLQKLFTYVGLELVNEEWIYYDRQPDYRCDYIYDEQDRVIEETWEVNDGSGWENDSRALYTWNDDGLATETWQLWSDEWTPDSLTLYAYDDNQWLQSIEVAYWDSDSADWVSAELFLYAYDEDGYCETCTKHDWNDDRDWMPQWRYEYFWEQSSAIADDTQAPPPATLRAWPNPFNPRTELRFTLAHPGQNRLDIYNVRDQLVVTLVDEFLQAGEHTVIWEAEGCASGVYLIRLQGEGDCQSQRVILLK
ncbi:MAG: T9SS type A sorting domain-containing protein [Candidatus Cloacimonetes bacterium]|nr:T9SS type A sorting domain-containing protein [Candidatus Cloacimonadota bacterium]